MTSRQGLRTGGVAVPQLFSALQLLQLFTALTTHTCKPCSGRSWCQGSGLIDLLRATHVGKWAQLKQLQF